MDYRRQTLDFNWFEGVTNFSATGSYKVLSDHLSFVILYHMCLCVCVCCNVNFLVFFLYLLVSIYWCVGFIPNVIEQNATGGAIRAVMMGIHAYFNIWCEARAGWAVFMKRRTAVHKISSLPEASEYQLRTFEDVCAICYQVREKFFFKYFYSIN